MELTAEERERIGLVRSYWEDLDPLHQSSVFNYLVGFIGMDNLDNLIAHMEFEKKLQDKFK